MRPAHWLLAACLLTAAGQADAAKVAKRLEVPATAKQLWRAAGGFCGLAQWHPDVASCAEKTLGRQTMRLVTLKDGGVLIDRLGGHDKRRQQLTYDVLSSPFPVTACKAKLFIDDDEADRDAAEDDDGTAIVWSAECSLRSGASEEEARKALLLFFQRGLIGLKEQFRGKSG